MRHKEGTLTNELACIVVSDDNETCRESIGVSLRTQPDSKGEDGLRKGSGLQN